jgi:hypothetical protein
LADDEASGALRDVRDARRSLHEAVAAPWWVSTLVVVGVAGAVASIYGGALTFAAALAAVAFVGAFVVLPAPFVRRWRRRELGVRFVSQAERVVRYRIARAVTFTLIVMVATVLKFALPPATVLTYAAQFAVAGALFSLYVWGMPRTHYYAYGLSRAVLKGHGPPGDIDELIRLRLRLKVCSVLAAIEEIDFGLLAEILRVNPAVLGEQMVALTNAQYAQARPNTEDSRRQWLSITKTGRQAYARHVYALAAA